MLLIVISPPEEYPNEHKVLTSLFDQGLEIFHLRKPRFSNDEMEDYLQSIPVKFHSRIVIHSHYSLASRYNIKGIHLTETSKQDKNLGYILKNLGKKTVSSSFHNLEEIQQNQQYFDYIFLSPIFESISKAGYKSNFDLNTIRQFILTYKKNNQAPLNIVALGGMNAENVDNIEKLGFSGFATLGYIWNAQDPLNAFMSMKHKLSIS